MRAVNIRFPFIQDADKEEYMRDYIEETKRTKMTKVVVDEKTQEKIARADVFVVTGIIEKPL